MTIDHIAIVVKDLDAAIDLYTQTLGFQPLYRETIADQGVEAVGLQAGDSVIELLRPLDPDSPIARFPRRRGGKTPPHRVPRRRSRDGASGL